MNTIEHELMRYSPFYEYYKSKMNKLYYTLWENLMHDTDLWRYADNNGVTFQSIFEDEML